MSTPIDVHVHPGTQAYVRTHGSAHEKIEKFFGKKTKVWTEDELAAKYVESRVRGVLLAFDAETATGAPRTSNEYVADVVAKYPEAFVCGFGSVDPWKGARAVYEIDKCAEQLGLTGMKFHPSVQAFYPNEEQFEPIWAACERRGLPVLIHSGLTGWPDVRTDYSRPIPMLDDLALRFPELTIISAHPAFPWIDEQVALALTRQNVYLDLSGYAPKYFPPSLVHEINSRLKNKALFGTDFPGILPDRWLEEFKDLGLKDEVVPKILWENAERALDLNG